MHRIDGRTKTFGLIGNPVEHTLSPYIHNMLAKSMDINMVYTPFHVEHGRLNDAIKAIRGLGIKGFNITVPYKSDVMAYLDCIDDKAQIIGAVNTVHVINGQLIGYNTDADGLYISCKRKGMTFNNKTICILGAGGAAKAVAIMCAQHNVDKIIIVNRTVDKATNIKTKLDDLYTLETKAISYDKLNQIDHIDICFQTTPLGMYPKTDRTPIRDQDFFHKLEYAIDLIYNPSETRFLTMAKACGAISLNGLGMLYYQAVKAFEIWHNVKIPDHILEECLVNLNKMIYCK